MSARQPTQRVPSSSLSTGSFGAGNPVETTPEIKKILVIGATGQAGSRIVTEALDRGLQVRAFSRNPSKLSRDVKDKVEAVAGDIINYDDVQKAVRGVDAVVVAISPGGYQDSSKHLYMTRGLKNVIKAMNAENVEIISTVLSAHSLLPAEKVPRMYKTEVADHRAMGEALRNSNLKYIATCPPDFTRTPHSEYEAVVGEISEEVKEDISLNQLAKFSIDSLSKPEYYRQSVVIRNKE